MLSNRYTKELSRDMAISQLNRQVAISKAKCKLINTSKEGTSLFWKTCGWQLRLQKGDGKDSEARSLRAITTAEANDGRPRKDANLIGKADAERQN